MIALLEYVKANSEFCFGVAAVTVIGLAIIGAAWRR